MRAWLGGRPVGAGRPFFVVQSRRGPAGRSAPRTPARRSSSGPATATRPAIGPLARERTVRTTGHPFASTDARPESTSPSCVRHDRPPLLRRVGERHRGRRTGSRKGETQQGPGAGHGARRHRERRSRGSRPEAPGELCGAHEGRVTRGRTSESGEPSNGPRRQSAIRSTRPWIRPFTPAEPTRSSCSRGVVRRTGHRVVPTRFVPCVASSACRLPLRHRHQRHRSCGSRPAGNALFAAGMRQRHEGDPGARDGTPNDTSRASSGGGNDTFAGGQRHFEWGVTTGGRRPGGLVRSASSAPASS